MRKKTRLLKYTLLDNVKFSMRNIITNREKFNKWWNPFHTSVFGKFAFYVYIYIYR